MNIWTSSAVDTNVKKATTKGSLWRLGDRKASQIILLTEGWSTRSRIESQWEAEHYIGWAGLTPGAKFGAKGGLGSLDAKRWGKVTSELPFYRHRNKRSGSQALNAPVGRLTIAYADGHAALRSHTDLVDLESGLSTLDSLWSLLDEQINR